jgi:excisionase family DNA binding protein
MTDWNNLPALLTVPEAMQLLRVKRRESVTKLCKNGQLNAMKIGNLWRIDRDSLRARLTTGQQPSLETIDHMQATIGALRAIYHNHKSNADDDLAMAQHHLLSALSKLQP